MELCDSLPGEGREGFIGYANGKDLGVACGRVFRSYCTGIKHGLVYASPPNAFV